MELSIISLVLNAVLGLVAYFMKQAHIDLKDDNKALWVALEKQKTEVDKIKDTYIKKEDFREFKEELFVRLDEMKLDFKQQIDRLRD